MRAKFPLLPLALLAALLEAGPTATRAADAGTAAGPPELEWRGNTVVVRGVALPDFSLCGYGGGREIPRVPAVRELGPQDGDQTDRIQSALDEISTLPPGPDGMRGALLLRSGEYAVDGTLRIHSSGVVLRGEGVGKTVLRATGRYQQTLLEIAHPGGGQWRELPGTRQPVVADAPLGATSVLAGNAAGFLPGDPIIILRPSTAAWIEAIGMDKFEPRDDGVEVVPWTPGSRDLRFDRVVVAVSGNLLTFDAPLGAAIEEEYGGGFVYKYEANRIANSGVEELVAVSDFQSPDDEEHGWVAVSIDHAKDCWARNLEVRHFGRSAVWLGRMAKWVTVENVHSQDPVSLIEGGRRYTFQIDGQLCLVRECTSADGRHDFVLGSTVPGPNVFLDCVARSAHSDSGPHQRWAVATLFDNVIVRGNALNLRNRGNSGTGHGWAGANSVLWNCQADTMICESPPTASNWAIGCTAESMTGDGVWVGRNQPVSPVSLFKTQREKKSPEH